MDKKVTKSREFNCCLIGEDKLVIQCGEILLKHHHRIVAIISTQLIVQTWANKQHILCFSSLSVFRAARIVACDYLFSIVNFEILPVWLLELPKYLAINYHDALLPRYAGVHATSWALLNQEKYHGITWHMMAKKIDAGDILKQQQVVIEKNETALSLNLKCYQAAIETFAELVNDLANGVIERKRQDLTQRSYFGLHQKPPGNGWINWRDTAENIERLFRALQMGDYPNYLSSLKFIVANQAYIITKLKITKNNSTQPLGSIVNTYKNRLSIATASKDIVISQLKKITGNPDKIEEMLKQHHLKLGSRLSSPSAKLQHCFQTISTDLSYHENFWLKQFTELSAATIPFLTADNTSNHQKSICLHNYKIPAKLYSQLKKRFQSLPPEHVLLTVCIIYLYRINAQQTVSVDITANFLQPSIKKLNSLVAAYVPFTAQLTDDMTFSQALKIVQALCKAIKSKGSYLADIGARHPEVSNARCPLPIAIVFDNISDIRKNNFPHPISFVISKNQICLFITKAIIDQNLSVVLDNIPGHLQTMLANIAVRPKKSISCIPLLTAAEQKKLLIDWNNTAADYPRDKTIPQLFEEQVIKTPDKIAVVFEKQQLTYQQLNEKANQLAHYLYQEGVTPGSFVAICLQRSLEMIIGMLGILKAGAAYVPIDPEYPAQRIIHILQDTQNQYILSQKKVEKKFKNTAFKNRKIILLDTSIWISKNISIVNRILKNINQPVYVMYTSGSTGKSKGVLISHTALINVLLAAAKTVGFTTTDTLLAISPTIFDISGVDIYLPLITGAKLVFTSDAVRFDPNRIMQIIDEIPISIMQATPAHWQMLIDHGWRNTSQIQIISTGEALSSQLANKLCEISHQVWNFYGPTEATIWSTVYRVNKVEAYLPIGKPLANTQLYVLSNQMQLVPVGAEGQLFIGGAGVAIGYLNRPALSKEKFITDIFSQKINARLYNTGDYVRWLPDGNLEYIGRNDEQVKIHGFRIEPSEIEAVLMKYPGIRQTIICARETETVKSLEAYFIKNNERKNQPLGVVELQSYLKKRLPVYMVPTKFFEVNDFPLTLNGKIDKKTLMSDPHTLLRHTGHIKQPRSKVEEVLTKVWQKVLGIKEISTNDNFFALGGDSILAMQVVAKSKLFGLSFNIKQIFLYPTIERLSLVTKAVVSLINEPYLNSQSAALAPIQAWFFQQQFSLPQQWSQVCLLDVVKSIDTQILRQCLKRILAHHETLKNRFFQNKHVWQQRYNEDDSFLLKIVNCHLDNERVLANTIEHWRLKIQESFNFAAGPLFGAVLIKVKGIPKKLLLAAHHLIIDGVSWRIVLEDMQAIYQGLLQKNSYTLPEKTVTYSAWIQALYHHIDSYALQEEIDFWLQQCSALSIATDFPEKINREADARVYEAQLSTAETKKLLNDTVKSYQSYINEILLAAFAQAFENWQGNNAVLVDIESHGREGLVADVDLSRTVGWFTSLYPLCLTWPAGAQMSVVLAAIRKQLHNVPHNGVGYGVLRYLSAHPVMKEKAGTQAQISFNYWGQFKSQHSDENFFCFEELRLVSSPENNRPYLLDINCWVVEGKLHISCTYNRLHYQKATIGVLVNNYKEALRCFMAENVDTINKQSEVIARYPLTSMQKGMLFHALHSPQSEAYAIQLHWQFTKKLNVTAFCQALQILVDRYDSLRSGFQWDGLDQPLQQVYARAEILCRHYDWQVLNKKEFAQRLAVFLKADRQAGFDVTQAPIMRVALIHVANRGCHIVLSFHHIILDGWCLPILLRELSLAYQSFCKKKSLELPQAPSYGNYVAWLKKTNHPDSAVFWRDYLSGFYAPTDLGIVNYSRDKKLNVLSEPAEADLLLPQAVSLQIKQFGARHYLALSTIFQGLWAILLARYSQTTDVVFGLTLSTRPAELRNSDKIIGMLINTLPLRVKFPEHSSVLTCLRSIQSGFVDLLEHRYSSLVDIESCSELSAEMNLFQSVMVFENYPIDMKRDAIFDFYNVKINDPTHYPLVFMVFPSNCFHLKINYNSALISKATITRTLHHLQSLLVDMVNHPQKSTEELQLLTLPEYHQLLKFSHPAAIKIPQQKLPYQLFEQQVKRFPQAIALVFAKQQLTYAELNQRANQLAHYLRRQGVKPETIVAICMQRSLEMVIGILAILKAGGAYLPIDPDLPDNRAQFILTDSRAQFLLSTSALLVKFNNIDFGAIQSILVDRDYDQIRSESVLNPVNITKPDNLMYVIYTSGSTGNPKGVMIEQHGVLDLVATAQRYLGFNRQDVWTLFHSIAFDFSVWEIWGALLSGATLVVVPKAICTEAEKFYALLIDHQVTVLSQTPSAFSQLVLADAVLQKSFFLKLIIFDGEVLAPSIVNTWFKSHDCQQPKLINMYGITEATVHSTYCHVTPDKLIDQLRYPIGQGFAGVVTAVLDPYQQPIPLGIAGELYIGGNGLARGYIDQQLTNQRFIYKKFADGSTQRLYKSGDLVRRLDNGELDYLGRLDNQIKLHGFRIELDEINAWVEKYPGVSQAITVLKKTVQDHHYLLTYLLAKQKSTINFGALLDYLRGYLPDYMLPGRLVCLDHFPLNNSGKIDKQALPLPDDSKNFDTQQFAPARTAEEKILAQIWQNILGIEQVSIHDNFFVLGGHSLLALQVLLQIKQRFKIELPVRAILDAVTIEKLADLIKSYLNDNRQLISAGYLNKTLMPCVVPLQTAGDKTPLFLIHPVGGTVFWYTQLVKYFEAARPLYGIQDPGVDASVIPFQTMQEMAAYYISAIRTMQPEGPYLLGGGSAGGNISIEIALQLRGIGQEVAFVGLLDTWAPYPDLLLRQEFFEAIMRRQYNTMHEKFVAKGILKADTLLALQWQRLQMYAKYQTPMLDFKLTLFKAEETTTIYQSVADQFNHWEHYTSQPIEKYWVPGDHETMFQEPYVAILGQKLTACLNAVELLIKQNCTGEK